VFISLEGVDGSGKSTQAELLLEALAPDAISVREPGGTEIGERIRGLVSDPELTMDPYTELLLFAAARAELIETVIRPGLEAGRQVISDRFADSTVAYQGGARELGTSHVLALTDRLIDGFWPDLTIYLRIDPEVGLTRAAGEDRFEAEGLELQRAVAEAYEEIATIASDRVVAIDASGGADEVHARVLEVVQARA
jgi:dTMP kinase